MVIVLRANQRDSLSGVAGPKCVGRRIVASGKSFPLFQNESKHTSSFLFRHTIDRTCLEKLLAYKVSQDHWNNPKTYFCAFRHTQDASIDSTSWVVMGDQSCKLERRETLEALVVREKTVQERSGISAAEQPC